tara:strand:- start:1599 stop:3050 length:1452 start_codon:yes stop_codon:yes gene_type:complete
MSSSDGKWELGVVAWSDSFEEFDQFTRLKTAYSAPTNANNSNTLALDNTISTNYLSSPYYLYGELDTDNKGSEIIVGPSSNATYDGAVDRAVINAESGNNYTFALEGTGVANNVNHVLSPAFSANDPVLVRTVPHNWSVSGSNTLNGLDFGVRPISRYDESFVDVVNLTKNNPPDIADIDVSSAYQYFNQKAVRLISVNTSPNTLRYIHHKTGVNTISPYINRYRMGWYYRLVKSNPRKSAGLNSAGLNANIKLIAKDAAGNTLAALTNENGVGDVEFEVASYTTSTFFKDVFTEQSKTFGLYQPSSGDAPDWNLTGVGQTDPNSFPATRINQLEVQIGLFGGANTAFDVDDMVIEHAQGTSGEDKGFVTIDHYPETGSISWQYRRPTEPAKVTANNVMRKTITTGNKKPKHIISASFENAPIQAYLDIRTLIGHQDRGNLIALRCFHEGLPNVVIGFLTVTSFSNQMWDLGRVTFGLRFEEA